MTLWLDAQLPPSLAPWFHETFGQTCYSLKNLELDRALDRDILLKAKEQDVVLVTKDADFLKLLDELGPPPKVLYLRLGNSTNAYLRDFFLKSWQEILPFFEEGVSLVEVGQKAP